MKIPLLELPEEVTISTELIEEERPQIREHYNPLKQDQDEAGPAFHEKKKKIKGEFGRLV